MSLTRREVILTQLCSPGFQGDLLQLAMLQIPIILEQLKLPPTNEQELKSLIVELQSSRTEVALSTYLHSIKNPKEIQDLKAPIRKCLWIKDYILLHLSVNTSQEEAEGFFRYFAAQPGMDNITLLLSTPDEDATLVGYKEANLPGAVVESVKGKTLHQFLRSLQDQCSRDQTTVQELPVPEERGP